MHEDTNIEIVVDERGAKIFRFAGLFGKYY